MTGRTAPATRFRAQTRTLTGAGLLAATTGLALLAAAPALWLPALFVTAVGADVAFLAGRETRSLTRALSTAAA